MIREAVGPFTGTSRWPTGYASVAQREVSSLFASEVAIYLPDDEGKLRPVVSNTRAKASGSREQAVATWAFDHGQLAGNGTDTDTHTD